MYKLTMCVRACVRARTCVRACRKREQIVDIKTPVLKLGGRSPIHRADQSYKPSYIY